MSGCATTYHAGAPKGAIDVIAHRGASAYAPENTLASFALAKELDADWFELDCTLTQDGQILVIHDDKVDRTTNGKGAVADLTLAELKKLDAGSWQDPKFAGEPLPTLGEALDLARQKRIGVYIEIKNCAEDGSLIEQIMRMAEGRDTLTPTMRREMMARIRASHTRNLELTRKVITEVRKRRMTHQVVIQSFSPIICAVALDEAPKFRTELLASKDEKKPERWPMYLKWTGYLNPPGFNTNPESLDEALLKKMHAEGRTVAVWTVDEEPDMRGFVQWGVDAIITNRPDLCLKVLKEMGKH
jgi:glycerophosphoryl diester phosphodiesterase